MSYPAASPEGGEVIAGKYRVLRLLGRGGMGAVYLCHHELLRQNVAVKMLHGGARAQTLLDRFLREAQATARIRSERIVHVHDVGTLASGAPYIVMEYLEGRDLDSLLKERRQLGVSEAVDIILEVLEGVGHAHDKGVVHRDLKPANVYLSQRGGRGASQVKLLDFGISKIIDPDEQSLTKTGGAMGSPLYMSPEQVRNPKNAGPGSDLWSVGIILYESLVGIAPFRAETLSETLAGVLERQAPSVCEHRPDVPPELDAIVQRCLEKGIERRYSRAIDVARALEPFASPRGLATLQRLKEQLASIPPPPGGEDVGEEEATRCRELGPVDTMSGLGARPSASGASHVSGGYPRASISQSSVSQSGLSQSGLSQSGVSQSALAQSASASGGFPQMGSSPGFPPAAPSSLDAFQLQGSQPQLPGHHSHLGNTGWGNTGHTGATGAAPRSSSSGLIVAIVSALAVLFLGGGIVVYVVMAKRAEVAHGGGASASAAASDTVPVAIGSSAIGPMVPPQVTEPVVPEPPPTSQPEVQPSATPPGTAQVPSTARTSHGSTTRPTTTKPAASASSTAPKPKYDPLSGESGRQR